MAVIHVKLMDGSVMRVTAANMEAVKNAVENNTWVEVTEADDFSDRWVQVSNIVWIMKEPSR